MLCIRTYFMIVIGLALLSGSDAIAQRAGVGALRQRVTTDSTVTLPRTARRLAPAFGSSPPLGLPVPPRADQCDCTRRMVAWAIAGGTFGALIGYQLAKFPDGGTQSIRLTGAVVGFVAGAASGVKTARQYP
jgi:hypothetical protein